MTSFARLVSAAALFVLPLSSTASASSDDAWDEFAKDVAAKCTALAEGRIEEPKVVVDPFGTESYGMAILTGKAVGADATVSSICVYDKKSQTAEIGGELPADQVTITVP
ncbi:hypothetical protein ASE36_04100 [Rhizobium sp. Root274]|uniref:hypothetical protein n=1 Tax=unclassified Rhizobium TaxID=2613769 RepID=UPI0007127BB9|nr:MULTISPECIES: hypothetical protein [unclassified Rhizobium]KQW31440.1 hypothetical protein ASC71_04105 [Rhizobium sp. Root1240]KRD32982.1 hypothetical protein ASE36_04100 [Rhizobium sp. Root274]